MAHCPDCNASGITGEEGCPRCSAGRALSDGGQPPAETDDSTVPADEAESVEHDTISRRAMLGYGGGSALLTFAVAGAGWYAFIYEPRTAEEELVREYFSAIDRDHYNTAALLFHEDSPDSPWAADRGAEGSQREISVDDTEVVERWENAEHEAVEEYALVVADVEMDSGFESETFAIGVLVAKNTDDEWRIWRDEEDDSSAALD
jgi:hypothetical protein